MSASDFVSLKEYREYPAEEMVERARRFCRDLRRRRTVRDFDDRPVPREVVDWCIRAGSSAPSGANRQPWHFAVVESADVKRRIREAAEEEERAFYEERAPDDWLEALEPLGTGPEKPFLEEAPYLIAIFAERYGLAPDGSRKTNYYVQESVGIATGMLITALHQAGLATLTHTPSPMNFLNEILDRPENEKPFLLLVTGYPEPDARVPDLEKKTLEEVATYF